MEERTISGYQEEENVAPSPYLGHAVTHANHYCIMFALPDSLAATSIGSNARHHQSNFRNQSDIYRLLHGRRRVSFFGERCSGLRQVRSFPIGKITPQWYAFIGSNDRVMDLTQISFEGTIHQRYIGKFLLR